ncbi:MAG TPA: hypothetical protein VMZ29_03760 [Candidatus Bathyarchaeia archaeon]|nr:hypothetical protein [Candidatus Bathyarchaeia archaeon]
MSYINFRFYRIYGIVISLLYSMWIIIGFTYDWPYWIIFAMLLPAFIIVYLMYYTIRYFQNPKPPEDPIDRIEHEYVNTKL